MIHQSSQSHPMFQFHCFVNCAYDVQMFFLNASLDLGTLLVVWSKHSRLQKSFEMYWLKLFLTTGEDVILKGIFSKVKKYFFARVVTRSLIISTIYFLDFGKDLDLIRDVDQIILCDVQDI